MDFTFATSTALVPAIGAGIPIVPISAFPLPATTVDGLARAEAGIVDAAGLAGRRVAFQRGTTGQFSLIKYLEGAGLTLDDVEGVSLTGAEGFTALSQGEVDAWFHWQPAATLGLARLGDAVVRLPGVPTVDWAFYIAREGFHAEHPDVAIRLAVAVRDVQRLINADPAGAVASWAALGAFDAESLEARVFEELVAAQRLSESTATEMGPADAASAEATQVLADDFHALGVLPDPVDVPAFLLDPRFEPVRAAAAAALAG